MSEINVISRTQHIIVEPTSRSVSVINEGPAGPSGAVGPHGPAGPGMYQWTGETATTAPTTNGTLRFNAATPETTTVVWATNVSWDNLDVRPQLLVATPGDTLYLQDYQSSANWYEFNVVSVTPAATYVTYQVSFKAKGSPILLPRRVLLGIKQSYVVGAGIPAGGNAGQVLTKVSNADFDFAWRDLPRPT